MPSDRLRVVTTEEGTLLLYRYGIHLQPHEAERLIHNLQCGLLMLTAQPDEDSQRPAEAVPEKIAGDYHAGGGV